MDQVTFEQVFLCRGVMKNMEKRYMYKSFKTWTILYKRNLIVLFNDLHHQNQNFMASIIVVSTIL